MTPDADAALRERLLITATALAKLLAGPKPPVVLAVRQLTPATRGSFDRADRVPGALETDMPTEFAGPGGGTRGSRPLPDIADLEANARLWGIDEASFVVVYDHDRGLVAGRAWWVLRWAGVREVRLLDGGFAAWQAAGLPVSRELPGTPKPTMITLSPGHLPTMDEDEALRMAREGILLDSRIRPNYIGGAVPPGSPARGHIPGAVSAPAVDNLGDAGTFADAPTLRELYRGLGADGMRKVGVYCGAGVSAAHDIIALASVGILAPMYVGSWSAWSADPSRPVVRGASPG